MVFYTKLLSLLIKRTIKNTSCFLSVILQYSMMRKISNEEIRNRFPLARATPPPRPYCGPVHLFALDKLTLLALPHFVVTMDLPPSPPFAS